METFETSGRRPSVGRELVLMGLLFTCYWQIRHLTKDDTAQALGNARRVIGFERALNVFSERAVQDLAMNSGAAVTVLNHYYVGVHFPLTAAFVVWVLVRRPDWYRRLRWWIVSVTAIALAIHVAYPLAPPRMLTEHGFVDTLSLRGPRIYSDDPDASAANQFAAMRSLHFEWAAIVAGGFVAKERTRLSLLALLHPLITLLSIVATANHYWTDAAVAGVLVVGVAALPSLARQLRCVLAERAVSHPLTIMSACTFATSRTSSTVSSPSPRPASRSTRCCQLHAPLP